MSALHLRTIEIHLFLELVSVIKCLFGGGPKMMILVVDLFAFGVPVPCTELRAWFSAQILHRTPFQSVGIAIVPHVLPLCFSEYLQQDSLLFPSRKMCGSNSEAQPACSLVRWNSYY